MPKLDLAVAAATALLPVRAHADEDEAPPLSVYGSARLDVLADSAEMNDIHAPMFVAPHPGTAAAGELTMTPRLSQVGLSIDEWQLDDRGHYIGEGKLEVDFAGGTDTNIIRLRHAYATVTAMHKVEILAGQTWDLISPLYPSVQNDTQLLFAGNTGDRRPQLRLSALPIDNVRIAVAAAATGTLDQRDLDGDGRVDGVQSGRPMLQGLVELRQPMRGSGGSILMGLWGHVAREEANGRRTPSRSFGAHVQIPARFAVLSAEIYGGTNAADVGGGVGHSMDPMVGRNIHSVGGWGELALRPTSRHQLAFGASADVVNEDDVMDGERTANGTGWAALRYAPKPSLLVGVEYLYWRTLYKGSAEANANRLDLHLSVLF